MIAGLRRDLWTAMSPDISQDARRSSTSGDKALRAAIERQGCRRRRRRSVLGQALDGLVAALPHASRRRRTSA